MLLQAFSRQDAYVCLRCQLQSLSRATRISTLQPQHRHASLQSRPFTSEPSPACHSIHLLRHNASKPRYGSTLVRSEEVERTTDGKPYITFTARNSGFQDSENREQWGRGRQNESDILYSSEETKGDRGLFRNVRKLQSEQKTVVLDHPALGKPAQIRILYEQRPDPKEELKDTVVVADDQPTSTDLLRAVTTEEATNDQPAAVQENIDNLRNVLLGQITTEASPTLSQCQEVALQLFDGFNTAQLAQYLKNNYRTESDDYLDLTRSYHGEKYRRSPWGFHTTDFVRDSLSRLRPRAKLRISPITECLSPGRKTPTKKQMVVEGIFRNCWNVMAEEERRVQGEIDIRIQPKDLELLLNHKTDVFVSLSEQYNAKIEVSKALSVIRLTSDFNTCFDLLKLIHLAIQSIRVEDVEIGSLGASTESSEENHKAFFDTMPIKELERMTNTMITPVLLGSNRYPTMFRVRYLGPETTALEDVRRLLTQLKEQKLSKHSKVLCLENGRLLPSRVPIDVGESLPWLDRATRWQRWSYPLSKIKDRAGDRWKNWRGEAIGQSRILDQSKSLAGEEEPSVTGSDILQREAWVICELRRFLLKDDIYSHRRVKIPSSEKYWAGEEWRRLEAIPGLVLYPEKKNKKRQGKDVTKTSFHASLNTHRTIIPNKFSDGLAATEKITLRIRKVRHFIIIHLRPHIPDNAIFTSTLPKLELHVLLNGFERRAELVAARLVVQEKEVDLLLPDEAADVRFSYCSYIESKPQMIDPSLHAFVLQSELNVWGNRRLKTPPRLQLRVPGFATRPSAASKPISDNMDTMTNDVQCEYVFTSLEYKSNMSFMYQTLIVACSTIEAGRSGGKRSELRLRTYKKTMKAVNIARRLPQFYKSVRQFLLDHIQESDVPSKINPDAVQEQTSEPVEEGLPRGIATKRERSGRPALWRKILKPGLLNRNRQSWKNYRSVFKKVFYKRNIIAEWRLRFHRGVTSSTPPSD